MAPPQLSMPAPAQPRPPQVLQPQPPQAQPNLMFQQQQIQQIQSYQMAMHPHQQQQQYMNNPGAWPIPGGAYFTPQQILDFQQDMLTKAAQYQQQQQQQQQTQYMNQQMQHPATYPTQVPPVPPAPASLAGHKRSLEETGVAANNPGAAKQLNTGGLNGSGNPSIPQQDGPADDDGGVSAPASAAPSTGAAAGGDDDEDEEDEEGIGPGDSGDELNEADDLADVDDHEEIDEEAINEVVLGQFEKVHRSKAKWKVNLKNCVATINGVDYLLKKVTGEMNF
jgi:Transcription factor IIA, alpha/beta subunit